MYSVGMPSPDLDEALEQQIEPAAEVALHRAGRDPDDRAQDGQDRPNSTEMRKP